MITGSDSVGIGSTISLTDSAAGGTWSSSDTSIATISTTGVVSGLDTGMTTITYMVTNICGTSWSAKTVYVGPASGAGVIYGPDSVCVGSAFAIVFADTMMPGGTWSVTNGNGTISSAGTFTGIIGSTIDTVVYTVTNGFGTVSTTKEVRISSTPPHVTVTGPDTTSLSVGTTAFVLIGSPAGGTFTSSDPTRVTFTTSTGNFVILRRGVVNLYYSYTNACGTGLDTFVVYLPLPSNINGFNAENAAVLNVYPNPNTGAFAMNLLSAYDEQAHVVVTNMVGQIVNEFNMPTNKANEINLNQPSGVYMVSATTNHGKYTTKVTITE
jgi:hypothetical protein